MTDELKDALVEALNTAKDPAAQTEKPKPKKPRKNTQKSTTPHPTDPPHTEIHVNGSTVNGIVAGQINGTVIHTQTVVHKTTATPQPGVEHITEEQAARLHALVDDVADLESKLKKEPKSYQAIWKSLNRHCKVATYRMIKQEDFTKAEKYLKMWKGRLSSSPSAPKKDPDWRKGRIKAINTICNQLNLRDKKNAYIKDRFQATSLLELTDEELEETFRACHGWKQSAKKKNPDLK